ncbi:FecR family protein [uncultured Kriegella sp.]|uniref:FecR family protein n=1 Tax=uncultured Kriegella sp. TaxID=1798910 RepID=UPI0030DB7CEA|tara:strand:- start:39197 stop:40375 length:1179 start_codon:yes stop_codon:yes gene_type:complete
MSKTIKTLIVKYLTKEASISELDKLSKLIENPSHREELIRHIKINHAIDFNMKKFGTDNSKRRLLEYIEQEKKTHRRRKVFNLVKCAAVILLFFGLGYFYKNGLQQKIPDPLNTKKMNPVALRDSITVGSDKATLTLEDGTQIDLEKGKALHTKHIKSNGEKLEYDSTNSSNTEIVYNYLTIPRGGQFHLKLADGTLVWLNSESQLKYPVEFIEGKTREVELVYGEAYFEVSPSTEHKGATFKVLNPSQEIEVLGTAFNVKAYRDEKNIYTTLVEGEISIGAGTTKQILKPNQQSNVNLEHMNITIIPVNVAYEISWKKGFFSFKGKSLEAIAKVLSRWYDVNIIFSKPELKNVRFNGVLSKEETIDEILNSILTTNSIEAYEIKNKEITIK